MLIARATQVVLLFCSSIVNFLIARAVSTACFYFMQAVAAR